MEFQGKRQAARGKVSEKGEVMTEISRRKFLQGALLAGAGAAGAGALAACSPSQASSGSGASSGSAGTGSAAASTPTDTSGYPWGAGDYPWEKTPPTIAEADIEEELECDVVVVGAGISGSCAIRAAAEEGADVIFFEKTGDVTASSSQMAILGGKVMATWGRDGIDKDLIVDHEMDECCYFPKRAIWNEWAVHGHEVFDWYIGVADTYIAKDQYDNIEDHEYYVTPQYYPLPTHYDWTKEKYPTFPISVTMTQAAHNKAGVEKAIAEYGARPYYKHAVKQLIKEGDRVTGCYAYNYETGKYKKVAAKKGVILCTGDYSSNKDLLAYFVPDVFKNGNITMYMNVDPDGVQCNQGDGLWLGDWVGARVQQHHAPMIHHMGQEGHETDMYLPIAGVTPWLRLDKFGNRFMNEEVPGQQNENQQEHLKDCRSYLIFDENWSKQLEYMPASHGCDCYLLEEGSGHIEGGVTLSDMANAVENGQIYKADTLEALFDILNKEEGFDKEQGLKSVARYNELCKNGYDEDFGKSSWRLFAIETGPFYASRIGLANMLAVCGGLESDEQAHTFDADRNIIPGLYVAGNIHGSTYGVQYPIAVAGICSALCMYYGYVAGKNAAKGV
jgi:succinate dehydrogenase/fumarate reductase flavoprotein subunit